VKRISTPKQASLDVIAAGHVSDRRSIESMP
jgi:hypothetical protein